MKEYYEVYYVNFERCDGCIIIVWCYGFYLLMEGNEVNIDNIDIFKEMGFLRDLEFEI